MRPPARISIVIPCYNSGETLPQTLQSVRVQTLPPIEVIIVDDGSTDPATIALLDGLQDVTLVRKPNGGLPSARNAGFAAASGDYILPLDSDDWLEPDFLEKVSAALLDQDEASFAFAVARLEGEASGVLRKNYNFFEQLFFNQLPYCLLLPKRLWEEVGGYDESMRKGYEDWDFNIRLGAKGYFGFALQLPLFHYRVRSTGMLQATSSKLHGQLWAEIQARNPQLYQWGTLLKTWLRWRRRPSSYPLFPYFGWLLLHRLLPHAAFQACFRWLLRRSQSRRVTARSTASGGTQTPSTP